MKNIILYLCILLFLNSCFLAENNKEKQYNKPNSEKVDAFGEYLSKDENIRKKTYKAFFYKRYNSLLKQNKIDSAAQILAIVGRVLDYNFINDAQIKDTGIGFLGKYGSKLSKTRNSEILYNVGAYYYSINLYDSSAYYYNKAFVNTDDYDGISNDAMTNYSLIFTNLNNGKQDAALQFGQKSLRLFEKIKDTAMIGAANSAIACIYNFQNNYQQALKYEQKAYNLAVSAKDTAIIMVVAMNKINNFNAFDHPHLLPFIDSTFSIYQKWSERNLVKNQIDMNSWMAFKLVRENKLKEANEFLQVNKTKVKEVSNNVTENYYFNALAEYDLKAGANPENIKMYQQKIIEKIENEDYVSIDLYNQILYHDAFKKGDYKNAVKYFEKAATARDSLASITRRNKVLELEEKYQTEKKEQQITLQKSELARKNSFIAFLAAVLGGLILSLLAFYFWQNQKKFKQEKINSMNFTKQLLQNTEEERKRIAGDLHDSISHELLNLKSFFKKDFLEVNAKIDTIINDIRGISRNLHPVMFDKIGLLPNIEQLVERIQNQNNFFVSTELNYSGSLISADELQIYRIIQESLTNIVKYSKAHAAKIEILEEDDFILVCIKDNGKGFNVKETLNSGKAFGLHNIIERSRIIGAEAQINSTSEGTIITINIPTKS